MERILASPLFKKSRRFPNLLRFVVERSLHGHAEPLKERTLGIEVFGREPDYDTNLDPVVRTTAVEIRKRIAQYYHEAGHENEIRIDFPAGSYLPEFRMPEKPAVLAVPFLKGPGLRVKVLCGPRTESIWLPKADTDPNIRMENFSRATFSVLLTKTLISELSPAL